MGHPIDEFVVEVKSPNKVKIEEPAWYLHQMDWQHKATGVPVFLVQINVLGDNDWPLICAIEHKFSQIRLDNSTKKLSEFNKELKKYNER
jgi:hypothetical protein